MSAEIPNHRFTLVQTGIVVVKTQRGQKGKDDLVKTKAVPGDVMTMT